MLLQRVLFAAVVVAPFVASPATVEAQNRGLDRAAVATAQAEAVAGWNHKRAAKGPTEIPVGIAGVFGGGTLPPGISRTRPAPEPEPEIEVPEVEVPELGCEVQLIIVNGIPIFGGCEGTP